MTILQFHLAAKKNQGMAAGWLGLGLGQGIGLGLAFGISARLRVEVRDSVSVRVRVLLSGLQPHLHLSEGA